MVELHFHPQEDFPLNFKLKHLVLDLNILANLDHHHPIHHHHRRRRHHHFYYFFYRIFYSHEGAVIMDHDRIFQSNRDYNK
jgi:hypothetical protein